MRYSTTGGQKGWRLPSPAEMRSLVGPAVDSPIPNIPPGHPFLNIQPTAYWTVVPEANQPSYARYVDAFLGNVLSFIKIYTYRSGAFVGRSSRMNNDLVACYSPLALAGRR